jgi:hypothetical protein
MGTRGHRAPRTTRNAIPFAAFQTSERPAAPQDGPSETARPKGNGPRCYLPHQTRLCIPGSRPGPLPYQFPLTCPDRCRPAGGRMKAGGSLFPRAWRVQVLMPRISKPLSNGKQGRRAGVSPCACNLGPPLTGNVLQRLVVQPAASLIHARLKAAIAGMDTAACTEGHQLEARMARRVPKKLIGRQLSPKEATALLARF